jgi:cellobiose-specific phosphotransferase system component IIA
MALLNNVPFRPSCIVSALPQRYQIELEKQLGGAVAISTCRVEQLENAVKLRGATIAVVGASDDSLEIAERLSHSTDAVKVFLVHYQDKLMSKAMVNGFAGVFDLRLEQHKLAESIRQEALHPNPIIRRTAPSRLDQRRLLEHFVAINERLSKPQIAYELMLDGFLRLARSESGVLLLKDNPAVGGFRITASRDHHFSEQSEVFLPNDTVLQMLTGDILFFPDGLPTSHSDSWMMSSEYCIGVPLVAGNQVMGCLLAQTNEASDCLADYALVATHLLSRMQQQEIVAQHELLLATARQKLDTTWMLVDAAGRIVHREGQRAKAICPTPRLNAAKLMHASHEAHSGRAGSVAYHDHSVSYQALSGPLGDYALLQLGQSLPRENDVVRLSAGPEAIDFIKTQFEDSPAQLEIVEPLLESFQSGKVPPLVEPKTLRKLGIEITFDEQNLSLHARAQLMLVVLTLAKRVETKKVFSIALFADRLALTLELDENDMVEIPAHISHDLLIQLVLAITGINSRSPKWQFGSFGGRLEWLIESDC